MADSVTDEDLQKRRDRIAKLQADLAEAEATRAERESDERRKIEATQLDAEIARLEARVQRAKEASKASAVKEGSSGPLAQAKAQLAAAQKLAEQPVGPVDTNADAKGDGKKNDKE